MTRNALDAALIAAHRAGNGAEIGRLYAQAAEHETEPEAKAFFLTQAYIFALEAGDQAAETHRARLVALGFERDS